MKSPRLMSILLICVLGFARWNLEAAAIDRDDSVLSHIPRQSVRSSALAEVGYSHRRQILEIKFNNGSVYRYVGVPRSVYYDLMSAESKTAYYVQRIKRNYRSYHVRPRVKDEQEKS